MVLGPAAFTVTMRSVLVALLTLGAACSGGAPASTPATPGSADLDLGSLGGTKHATPADAAGIAPTPPPPAPQATAPTAGGVDFIEDARLLYRVAACGGSADGRVDSLGGGNAQLAAQLTKITDRHCKNILERIGQFRAAYFEKHRSWFEEVVPKAIPTTVVYPFGGGDLLSALVAFPDATEITTISLELAGDPRRMRTFEPNQLQHSLAGLRVEIGGLISVGSNTSVNLSQQQRNELPGQVSSFLIGLVAGGFEPISMRYFSLDDTGGINYLEQAEIDAVDKQRRKSLKGDWASPNFSEAFSHVEIQYRKPGETTVRVHRHLGWNLGDDYLTTHPQLLRHLEKKAKVTMMTKGASYLLQRPNFSKIRTYMLDHLAWMLSDSTGIAPTYANAAGMAQATYGTYSGAFLVGGQGNRHDQSFIELWRKNPRKKLPFRFGYVDASGSAHLVVTKPK